MERRKEERRDARLGWTDEEVLYLMQPSVALGRHACFILEMPLKIRV
jgi:hypothetical protein